MALVIEPLAYEALAEPATSRAHSISIPEHQVVLNEEVVDKILPRPRYDSHRLIEEYMIAANVAAAEALQAVSARHVSHSRTAGVGRRRDHPRIAFDTRFQAGAAGALRPTHFADILNRAAHTDKLQVVSDWCAQSKAVYGPDDSGHFD